MVPRRPRNLLTGRFFHITVRGTARAPIYLDDDDRRYFLCLLDRAGDAVDWQRHAYCLMTNHYHLVVETTVERLSRAMHRLNGRYAQEFNERYRRTGHLFENRFRARVIESEEYLGDACRYVEDNPVRAGLCATADEWPWSSAGARALVSRR
jgi:putative transposase